LSISEIPTHTHVQQASTNAGNTTDPTGHILAANRGGLYRFPSNLVALNPAAITNIGGSQAHLNMQPFLTISFCIALQGIFPSPT